MIIPTTNTAISSVFRRGWEGIWYSGFLLPSFLALMNMITINIAIRPYDKAPT